MNFGKASTFLDSEQLIAEVRKRPCLYDLKSPEYKSRNLRYEGWLAVAECIAGEQWKEMSKEDKRQLGRIVQKRWKSLKDAYSRVFRLQRTSTARPYVYHKQLSFLLPTLPLRYNVEDVERESSPELEELSVANEVEMKFIPDAPENSSLPVQPASMILLEATENVNPATQCAHVFAGEATKDSSLSMQPAQMFIPEAGTIECAQTQDSDDEQEPKAIPDTSANMYYEQDSDRMFLLSLLPSLKKVKSEDKLDAQIQLMEVLKSFTSVPTTPRRTSAQRRTLIP